MSWPVSRLTEGLPSFGIFPLIAFAAFWDVKPSTTLTSSVHVLGVERSCFVVFGSFVSVCIF